MDKFFVQRLILFIFGFSAIALAYVFRLDPGSHDALLLSGAGLLGSGAIKRPGDAAPGTRGGLALAALCFALTVPTACHQLNGLWPAAVKCAGGTTDLVGQVSQILLTRTDYQSKLEELTRDSSADVGPLAEEVICIVDQLVRDWSSTAAAANPTRIQAAARGRAFLAATGTKVMR